MHRPGAPVEHGDTLSVLCRGYQRCRAEVRGLSAQSLKHHGSSVTDFIALGLPYTSDLCNLTAGYIEIYIQLKSKTNSVQHGAPLVWKGDRGNPVPYPMATKITMSPEIYMLSKSTYREPPGLKNLRWTVGCFVVFLGAMAANFSATAQLFGPPIIDFDAKPWEEQKQHLPAMPKESNLKQVEVGPATSFRFLVDTESINVGSDGVVRFTLIARSEGGAANVSYEGIRCDTQERKIYSVGRPDGTWVAARNPIWVALTRQFVNPVHTVLYEDYFCPERRIVSSVTDAVDSIIYGGHPRGRTKRK